MSNEPDYTVEIGGQIIQGPVGSDDLGNGDNPGTSFYGRAYISVLFECCNVYQRIYRNTSATAYEGFCPKCLRKVRVRIGPGGTDARFFTAK
ncbi:MAG: hypothetical protein JXD22_00680 [Sedimentisphaerales bacterium]|nr:hypothetical protein [Sedimentisphaerales bacterium]